MRHARVMHTHRIEEPRRPRLSPNVPSSLFAAHRSQSRRDLTAPRYRSPIGPTRRALTHRSAHVTAPYPSPSTRRYRATHALSPSRHSVVSCIQHPPTETRPPGRRACSPPRLLANALGVVGSTTGSATCYSASTASNAKVVQHSNCPMSKVRSKTTTPKVPSRV